MTYIYMLLQWTNQNTVKKQLKQNFKDKTHKSMKKVPLDNSPKITSVWFAHFWKLAHTMKIDIDQTKQNKMELVNKLEGKYLNTNLYYEMIANQF